MDAPNVLEVECRVSYHYDRGKEFVTLLWTVWERENETLWSHPRALELSVNTRIL